MQIPGLTVAADQTGVLARGYWPSYNVPFYPEIYRCSLHPAASGMSSSSAALSVVKLIRILNHGTLIESTHHMQSTCSRPDYLNLRSGDTLAQMSGLMVTLRHVFTGGQATRHSCSGSSSAAQTLCRRPSRRATSWRPEPQSSAGMLAWWTTWAPSSASCAPTPTALTL